MQAGNPHGIPEKLGKVQEFDIGQGKSGKLGKGREIVVWLQ